MHFYFFDWKFGKKAYIFCATIRIAHPTEGGTTFPIRSRAREGVGGWQVSGWQVEVAIGGDAKSENSGVRHTTGGTQPSWAPGSWHAGQDSRFRDRELAATVRKRPTSPVQDVPRACSENPSVVHGIGMQLSARC